MYDIANQIIRTPTDPDITFSDDPLRILRVIRFSCRLGWGIAKETWFGMVKNVGRISIVSQERITEEIIKILCTKNASVGIRKMLYCGLLQKVLPDIYDMRHSFESRNPVVTTFDHTMKVLDAVEAYPEHRLAALFHDVGRLLTDKDRTVSPNQFSAEVAEGDLRKMKLPNDVIKSVSTAIRHHEWFSTYTDGFLPPDKKIRKLTVPDKPIEYFSEQQIESMINAPDRKKKIGRRNCLILTIEYDCALRIHEVTLLQLRDVHLKGDDPKIMVAGKGGTYLPVPLTDKSAALLKDYIKEFHEDSAPETPLFYGMYGKEKKAISVDTINNLISQSIESCMKKGIEFPKRCISHMIRKSRAMHLYERGVPLPHIQQILRHKSLNTTSGFYAFATLKTLRHSLEKADKVREENKNKNWKKPGIREKLEEISK